MLLHAPKIATAHAEITKKCRSSWGRKVTKTSHESKLHNYQNSPDPQTPDPNQHMARVSDVVDVVLGSGR